MAPDTEETVLLMFSHTDSSLVVVVLVRHYPAPKEGSFFCPNGRQFLARSSTVSCLTSVLTEFEKNHYP